MNFLFILILSLFLILFASTKVTANTEAEFEAIRDEIWNAVLDFPDRTSPNYDNWETYITELFHAVPPEYATEFLNELGWDQNSNQFSQVFHSRIESPLTRNLVSILYDLNRPPRETIDDEPLAHELGTICYADGIERSISPDHAVWMAKMIDGETWGRPSIEDGEAMLWSIAQRGGIGVFVNWDMTRLIKAYSQPVNPTWTRNGSRCREYYAPGFQGIIKDSCKPDRVDRRQNNIDKSWADTAETARAVVLEFSSGRIPNPVVGGVGWWAPTMWDSREARGVNEAQHQTFHSEIDGNVYFYRTSRPDTRTWDATSVRVVPFGRACP